MIITYTYKLQGDGSDSWIATVTKDGKVIDKYMVYIDPYKNELVEKFKKLTPAEILAIKNLLK